MATFKYYDGTKYNRITGGLVPKTTNTTSDMERSSAKCYIKKRRNKMEINHHSLQNNENMV